MLFCGMFMLDLMGLTGKYLLPRYTAAELSAYRNVIGMVPTLLALFLLREWHRSGRRIKMRRWKLALGRGLLVALAQLFFYFGIAHMEYAAVATITMSMSFFVTVFSVPLLGQRVGPMRWVAVVIGFVGVVLVMQPGSDTFSIYALMPLSAAALYALASVTVPMVDHDAPVALINLYSAVAAAAGALVLVVPFGGFSPILTWTDGFWIAAMGTFGGVGILFYVYAFRLTEPSNLAPFTYFALISSFTFGWLIFGEAPFGRLFPGALLIVIGGLVIIWRESGVPVSLNQK